MATDSPDDAAIAKSQEPPTPTSKTDVQTDGSGKITQTSKPSIVTVFTSHEPWSGHPTSKVPKRTGLSSGGDKSSVRRSDEGTNRTP